MHKQEPKTLSVAIITQRGLAAFVNAVNAGTIEFDIVHLYVSKRVKKRFIDKQLRRMDTDIFGHYAENPVLRPRAVVTFQPPANPDDEKQVHLTLNCSPARLKQVVRMVTHDAFNSQDLVVSESGNVRRIQKKSDVALEALAAFVPDKENG